MKSPLVTVIMPTYNHAAFVLRAIESVLAQQGVDFEFLISDDGSSDKTREVIASVDDSRIRFFPNVINRGACIVTNELIERATGEFIALINSDDEWSTPDKLAHQVGIMRGNPELGACFGRANFIDKEGNVIDKSSLPFGAVFDQENRSQGQWLRRFFDQGNCFCHPTILIRRSCYAEVGKYDNQLRQLPDFEMWVRLVKQYPVFISDRALINFRILPGENASSQTEVNTQRTINEHYLIASSFFEGCSSIQLMEGFSDLLHVQSVPSADHCEIEQTLLFFHPNAGLGRVYQLVGMQRLARQLGNPVLEQLLSDTYGIDARWFHKRTGDISSLIDKSTLKDIRIGELGLALAKQEAEIQQLRSSLTDMEQKWAHETAQFGEMLRQREHHIAELHSSRSWRVTKPVRVVSTQLQRGRRLATIVAPAVRQNGGLSGTIRRASQLVRREGIAGFRRGLSILASGGSSAPTLGSGADNRNNYAEWMRRYDMLDEAGRAAQRTRAAALPVQPLISVVMPTYNPKPGWLIEVIESVRQQTYANWELCIADDASPDPAIRPILERYAADDQRIKVVFREKNGHISAASNSALEVAKGSWIALLDHDDLLSEQALFWVAEAINRDSDLALIYSDEDKVDERGQRYEPYFKCDWNPDLFYSHNMISHLGVYRADVLQEIGGFRLGVEGSQDYDLALRSLERIKPQQIHHIPRVLYHWRVHAESTASSADAKPYAMIAGERAINEHFVRRNVDAKVELAGFGYRIRYALPAPAPLVSLIIPTRNGLALLRTCVRSILEKTTYPNYEILIVDNGSDDPATLAYMERIQADDTRVRVIRDPQPFNYSAINNAAVPHTRGEVLALINNDLEVITPDWLTEMVSIALQPDVGAVGARLWYPGDTLQHGGVILGLGASRIAGHAHDRMPRAHHGYFGRAALINSFSAVSAACLVIRRSTFEAVGGLNEVDLRVAFNDVDFCLRVRELGYRNVWTPYADLYHHESASRGQDNNPEKRARFEREVEYMKRRWGSLLLNDPAYSPNMTLDHGDFSLAWPPRCLNAGIALEG
jgi:glycosyltransferase involved in cell wall biosynthesis